MQLKCNITKNWILRSLINAHRSDHDGIFAFPSGYDKIRNRSLFFHELWNFRPITFKFW